MRLSWSLESPIKLIIRTGIATELPLFRVVVAWELQGEEGSCSWSAANFRNPNFRHEYNDIRLHRLGYSNLVQFVTRRH